MANNWYSRRDALNRLFRRCVECPSDVQPTCPPCGDGEGCSLKPQDCNNCASMICVKIDQVFGPTNQTHSTPMGPIIGGVVGGVFAIVLVTFLVWHFCIRKKKRQDLWIPPEKTTRSGSAAALTRTHSIASTVMTRASNVIQIAYIPGVTVRSTPDTPEVTPPMPSVPSTYTGNSAQTSPDVEQLIFMPKDLRDSVWSDASSIMTSDPRISIAPSLARASVATTIYQENAVPAIPAQYAYRAQANTVSLKSGSSTPSIGPSDENAPPMPQASKTIALNGSSIVARNVVARPIEVKKSSSGRAGPSLSPFPRKSPSRRATPVPTISDEKEVVFSSPSSINTIVSEPSISPVGRPLQQTSYMSLGGISGLSELPATSPSEVSLGGSIASSNRPTTAYAEAMIHEAMMRATQDTSRLPVTSVQRPELQKHDSGPFSDANEIR